VIAVRPTLHGPWRLPKIGATPDSSDDVARVRRPRAMLRRGSSLRLAVADGATQSYLAGHWAELVVDQALADPIDELQSGIDQLRSRWPDELARYRTERAEAGRPLAWFEESKLAEGAGATLLVVDIRRDTAELRAVGDSIAVHLRDGELVGAFPVDDPEAFGNSPVLLRTVSPAPTPLAARWDLQRQDRVVAATDAVGAWLLARAAEGSLASLLPELEDERRFAALVHRERDAGRMQDDDATAALLVV
jgi:hypothetical protein